MSKRHVLAVFGGSLVVTALLGCGAPAPLVAGDKAIAAEQPDTTATVDQSTLPPELAGLTPDELCQLMCQTMGGMGGELCRAMHEAGIEMTPMMLDPETLQEMAAVAQANQAQAPAP